MSNYIGAVGQTLPPPQALYPVTINNNPQLAGTNRISLAPGADVLVPPGRFNIQLGLYTQLQIYDPVSLTWVGFAPLDAGAMKMVDSDGSNYRLYNPTGFPIGAVVTNGGTGYTSAPTVAAAAGGSTWTAIVGGAISQINCANAGSGSGYSVPPIVNIAAPPSPGVQATAVAAISGGAISSFTIINPGAGYTSAPAVVIVPQNTDLNLAATSTTSITNATATAQTSFASQVTAVLLQNEGNNPLNTAPALTFAGGGGASATATALMAWALTNATVTTQGSGYPAALQISSIGGTIVGLTSGNGAASNSPAVSTALLNPPRPALMSATQGSSTGVQVGVIVDGGLFVGAAPTLYAQPYPVNTGSVAAAFGVTVGGANDTSYITPA